MNNLRTLSPLALQQRRLQLLKEIKEIDDELARRVKATTVVSTIEEHRTRAAHYASIGKLRY